ncbi:MAG: penicillin-binding protein 2 [Candidatus Saccharimonadales bacterium]
MKLELQQGSRSKILAAILLSVVAIFVIRLFYLQVIEHGKYAALADNAQLKRLEIPAKRGEIYAMDGSTPAKLVLNQPVYKLFADPQTVKDIPRIKDVIQRVAGGNLLPDIDEMLAEKTSRYKILAKGLSRTQADLIKKESLAGIGFQEETQRVYPEGQLAAQTLGFVNAEGKGQYGIEGKLNDRLTGTPGLLQSVTDISNVPLTIGDRNINTPAKNGDNIVLSLDRNVQSYAESALVKGLEKAGATNGSVIVMDPQTGKVMAMANYPTFKPAEFTKVQDGYAFSNATVSAPYEPASVLKTFAMAAGIDQGVMTADTTFNNTDSVNIDGEIIRNALLGHKGTLTMQQALNWSLNTGTVAMAQRMGGGSITREARDTLYAYYHDRFGLGQLTGLEVSGEAPGIVVSPTEQEGNAVRYSNMTFGQGLDVTMVQVAAGFSSIINGGHYYKPTILNGVIQPNGDFSQYQVSEPRTTIKESTSAQMRDMTVAARKSFFTTQDKAGYMIGGKTGTSETLINGDYVKTQTVGSYLGFGGDDTPRYVIMVQVSADGKNLEGGIHAGPIFTDISNWMIDYLKLQPKG